MGEYSYRCAGINVPLVVIAHSIQFCEMWRSIIVARFFLLLPIYVFLKGYREDVPNSTQSEYEHCVNRGMCQHFTCAQNITSVLRYEESIAVFFNQKSKIEESIDFMKSS